MIHVQLDLFEKNDEYTLLKKEVKELHLRQDNLRRGLFARFDELSKLYVELERKMSVTKE